MFSGITEMNSLWMYTVTRVRGAGPWTGCIQAMKHRTFIWLFFCVTAVAIFLLDTVTSVDISISVLYVTLVLVVRRTGAVKDILFAGMMCFFLTIISYAVTAGFSPAKPQEAGLLNVIISLFAITSVTYLSVGIAQSETRARKARDQVSRTMLGISINELATSVVHEINQPLGAIVANVAAARRWLTMTPIEIVEARAAMDAAVRDAQRAADVIAGLRRLFATCLSDKRTFDLLELIKDTVNILRPELNEHRINITMQFSQKSLPVDGDRTLLQQVFVNLFTNAIEAMEGTEIRERALIVTTSLKGDRVEVLVRDSGTGISPETLDHIFDPFYSTKPKGLGIGLAITRSIIEAHGASLRAFSNTPSGTVIAITLPKSESSFDR
jgi:signal transduction histidine kinase